MKQYKLIKWYPGCGDHKEGDIIIKCNSGHPLYLGKKATGTLNYTFTSKDVENNPEYWQEVVEKDYEILLMKNSHGNFYSLYENEKLGKYEIENHTIHSVKRLSDGKVFTIGDEVTNNSYKGKITSFKIHENTLKVYYDGFDLLKQISKVKQPLFKSSDDVEIFKKDRVFIVTDNFNIGYSGELNYYGPTLSKTFSTKVAAENYIKCNKPCLSFNDIWNSQANNILEHSELHVNNTKHICMDKKELTKLVKQKLKN